MATILFLLGGRFKSKEEITRRERIANGFLADPVHNRVIMEEVGYGPYSIESCAEGDLCQPGSFAKVLRDREAGRMDAVVIGCGDDPGLYAMRELLDIPVLGMTETSCAFSSILGERFSMITTSRESIPETRLLFKKYGVLNRCASIRYVSFSVLDMQQGIVSREAVVATFLKEVEAAREDGASSILMGCGTMAYLLLDEDANRVSPIPVLNPAKVAVKTAEIMLSLKQTHSRRSFPRPENMDEIRQMLFALPYCGTKG